GDLRVAARSGDEDPNEHRAPCGHRFSSDAVRGVRPVDARCAGFFSLSLARSLRRARGALLPSWQGKMAAPTNPPARHALGLYLGLLQLLFTLSWTAYVIYLPKLVAQGWVLWILVLDQIIFSVCDWSMGVAADRVSKVMGRLGKWVALVTAASCLAFLLLPL